MREVAAFGQTHTQNCVAWLGKSQIDGLVGLGTGTGLHIGALCAKQFLHTLNGNQLSLINALTPAVIALAGIAFSIFVGQLRTLRFHDCIAGVVLGRNQLNVFFLATGFVLNLFPEFWINFGNGIFRGKHHVPHVFGKRHNYNMHNKGGISFGSLKWLRVRPLQASIAACTFHAIIASAFLQQLPATTPPQSRFQPRLAT